MGNQFCAAASTYCNPPERNNLADISTARTLKQQAKIYSDPLISIPKLSPQIQQILEKKSQQLKSIDMTSFKKVRFGGDIYHGQINDYAQPNGTGKMYKYDGSLFFGTFHNGKAQGKGLFIMSDGSYFQGNLQNNQAQCIRSQGKGVFHSKQFAYYGQFHENKFDGQGQQRSKSHNFRGTYKNGVKLCGDLYWGIQNQTYKYSYYGKFDQQGLFTDQGSLQQPTGIYLGGFFKGKKHGQGTYKYHNNLIYQGQYSQGVKCGQGRIIQGKTNQIIYEGGWKNGLPDGQGFKYGTDRKKIQTFFKDGINILALQDRKELLSLMRN